MSHRRILDQKSPPPDPTPSPDPTGLAKLIFKSNGQSSNRRYEGQCTFVFGSGRQQTSTYSSHASALNLVLSTLSAKCSDEAYLSKVARSDAFRICSKGNDVPLLSRTRNNVLARPNDGVHPREVVKDEGWWLSQQTGSAKKFQLITKAASLRNVEVVPDNTSKYGF